MRSGTIEDDPRALDTQKVSKENTQRQAPGYVAPDAEVAGGADTGITENDMEEDQAETHQKDDVVLMQQQPVRDYETVLENLLAELETMLKPKAERLSGFLRHDEGPKKVRPAPPKPKACRAL